MQGQPAGGRRPAVFRLRPVRVVGCTGGGAGLVTHGPRDRDAVALTFDDGPSSYTDAFVDVLREEHAVATFFEIGQEIAGREETMRHLLREGSEIGNHTTHHQAYPGYADLKETSDLIEGATHFRPCLFRPPDGAENEAVVAAGAEAGMTTVTWDVDPSDWSNPGQRSGLLAGGRGRAARARSSSCTTAAAPAPTPSPRCRRSSRRCGAADTASSPSPNCSGTD